MFFDKISNSWNFATQSYSVLWDHKSLLVFPIVSLLGMAVVLMTFLFPMGILEALTAGSSSTAGESIGGAALAVMGVLLCVGIYFVTAFFNAALVACTFQAIEGREPEIGHGFAVASKRAPSLLGWALISAVVSSILGSLEKHDRIGDIVSDILGMAWSAMTYFVIPIIVVEGEGPISAVKSSTRTLRDTWGEALLGNFSLGLLGFLLALPGGLIIFGGVSMGMNIPIMALGGVWVFLAIAASSAADAIFKALLYDWATGASIDPAIDTSGFGEAFASKGGRW